MQIHIHCNLWLEKPKEPVMGSYKVIFEGKHSRALCFDSQRADLFVKFDHMRIGKDGFEVPKYSKYLNEANFGQLIVQTASNDWYLNSDFCDLCDALSSFSNTRQSAISMAFSMGGYAALLFSPYLELSRVLLVSPQFSPFANLAPFDRRYSRFFQPSCLIEYQQYLPGNTHLKGHVVFDPNHWSMDAEHARLICNQFPKILPVKLEGGGHPCTKKISEFGNFKRLQRKFLLNRVTDRSLKMMHCKPTPTENRGEFALQPEFAGHQL